MIFDLIQKRRSIFPAQYKNEPIAKADVEKILEAANWAPTHKKTEPWRFKVLMGDAKKKLGLFLSYKYMETEERPKNIKSEKIIENSTNSGAVIAICMQRDLKESIPDWEEVAATAMAVQNMWLCCTEMGIGCYWSSPGLIKFMGEFFDLKEGEICLGFFYMGHFDGEVVEQSRGPVEEKVVWMDS